MRVCAPAQRSSSGGGESGGVGAEVAMAAVTDDARVRAGAGAAQAVVATLRVHADTRRGAVREPSVLRGQSRRQ